MRKITFVIAPLTSTEKERDEVADCLARYGANAVVLLESWKLSTIDVDPGFDAAEAGDVGHGEGSSALAERIRMLVASALDDLANKIAGGT